MAALARVSLGLLLLLTIALATVPADTTPPPNPHLQMNATGGCAGCHRHVEGTLQPHEFIVAIAATCRQCHAEDQLGRTHPVGVDPKRSPTTIAVPEELPLEDGLVSCGSCHNPHREHLSRTYSFRGQEASYVQVSGRTEIPWYATLFLRKPDPAKGFETLCVSCHKDY